MRSERDKMLAGELCDPSDQELTELRLRARERSVVTRDVPAGVVAAGNPARLIREIR